MTYKIIISLVILATLALVGCSKAPDIKPEEVVDMEETKKELNSDEATSTQTALTDGPQSEAEEITITMDDYKYTLYQKPPVGWVGDVMPFFENNMFHIFYLQDWRDENAGFHPWHKFTTENLIDYKYNGEMIPYTAVHLPDLAIGTGDVIKVGNEYHAFYTGHNYLFPDQGKPKESVMHAISSDLEKWVKIPEDTFTAPEGYEINDFRDPFIIFNEEMQEYWMLLAARKVNQGGVIALFTSKDLKTWEVQDPLYTSGRYFMLECPQIFKMGDYWYLTFSEFSDKKTLHYRMSTSMSGPWETPTQDVLDGKCFYAPKSAASSDARYLFGWIPTKKGFSDSNLWEWAGNLAVHQLTQNPDGTLAVSMPDIYNSYFDNSLPINATQTFGEVTVSEDIVIKSNGDIAGAIFERVKTSMFMTATIQFTDNTRAAGIAFNVKEDLDSAYGISLDMKKDIICYESILLNRLKFSADPAYVPLDIEPNLEYELKVIVENDICVVYVNDQIALSTRIYNLQNNKWGLFALDGEVIISDLKLFSPTN